MMRKPFYYETSIKVLTIFLLIAAFSWTNYGATFTVSKVADTNDGVCNADCSLREAISAANGAATDDIINFDTAVFNTGRVITLTNGELSVINNGALSILGTGSNILTIQSNNQSRILFIDGADLTVKSVTITGGRGAGVFSGSGGGVYISSGNVIIDSVIIRNNSGFIGGGISNNGSLDLRATTISSNTSTNSSTNSGGGIYNSGTLIITNSNINNNSSAGDGGAINNNSGTVNILNSTLSVNSAANNRLGGAIYNNSGTVNITGSSVNNNLANGFGGGIYNIGSNAVVSINASSIRGNSAGFGGAVNNQSGGTVTIINSTVSENSAVNSAAAILNNASTVNLTNVTVARNRAFSTSGSSGGILNASGGTVNSRNSIIADNTADSGIAPDFSGTLTSQGYNLIENLNGINIIGTTTGNILGQDPLLSPPSINGVIDVFISLQAISPAVDAADPDNFPPTDQRNIARPQDGDLNGTMLPDIGAYERQPVVYTVTKLADTNDGICDADCSLREAIAIANGSPAVRDKAVVFDANVFAGVQTLTLTSGQILVAEYAVLTIKGTGADRLTISGNNASRVFFFSVSSVVAVSDIKIANGRADGSGSGIFSTQGAILAVTRAVVTGNKAEGDGGGIVSFGRLYMKYSVVSDNTANIGSGGGIYASSPEISNSIISNNFAFREGGGVYSGKGSIERCIISGNTAVSSNSSIRSAGGGLFVTDAPFSINNSTVSFNTTSGAGGGIYSVHNTNINNSTINNNSSSSGGGISNSSFGTINIVSSTISGNTSSFDGGGIFNSTGSGVTNLTSTTIANNFAARNGGGVCGFINDTAFIRSKNSIIANNSAGESGPDVKDLFTSQGGFNLIGNTSGTRLVGDDLNNIYGQDPQLLPLGNYGGVTRTHALRLTSPALDKGNSFGILADQRDQLRPYDFPAITNASGGNGTDIGAFERQPNDVNKANFFDFDGDGKADVSVFRPENGGWYLQQSQAGFVGLAFGDASDKLVPGDYDGDGKTDVAVWRPSNGYWYLQRSSQGFTGTQFGQSGDIPVPGDYDGDGRTDIAVFRPSNGYWYLLQSTAGFTGTLFGVNGDKPVPADYDGDGKTDLAVNRNGIWYLNRTQLGFTGIQFGDGADKLVPADYDGDGKTDLAVFRPSNGVWYLQQSTAGFVGIIFGLGTDIPAPADYDGDGKADLAVVRQGNWYLNCTSQGFTGIQFGTATDKPVPNTFVR